MSCIELYRGDLCHFHLLAISRKHCRFCNMFLHTRCARARACVCVWGGGGGGVGLGWTKLFKIKQMGWGAELANVAPIVDKLFKKSSRF